MCSAYDPMSSRCGILSAVRLTRRSGRTTEVGERPVAERSDRGLPRFKGHSWHRASGDSVSRADRLVIGFGKMASGNGFTREKPVRNAHRLSPRMPLIPRYLYLRLE